MGLLYIAMLYALPVHATDISQFQGSFDGWSQQWNSASGNPSIVGNVSLDSDLGYGDTQSLKFDMGTGFGDDGTLWIEKSYLVPPGVPTNVDASFYLYSLDQSDLNQFQVKAYVGATAPQVEADFSQIGWTDEQAGWYPYDYSRTIASASGTVWVGLGVRVDWEGPRTYWIDDVQVSGVVPEPSTFALLATAGLGLTGWAWRRRKRSGV